MSLHANVASPGVGRRRWHWRVFPWCSLVVLVTVTITAAVAGAVQQENDSRASSQLEIVLNATLQAKSFMACGHSSYLPGVASCTVFHSPDEMETRYEPPYSDQKLIYYKDRAFASLGYGVRLVGSQQTQELESAALVKADLWLERPMARSEVVSEVQQKVFDALRGLQAMAQTGTTTQTGSLFIVKSWDGAWTSHLRVHSGFVVQMTTRAQLSPGRWVTSIRRLSDFNDAPGIRPPDPGSIVTRQDRVGCAIQAVVPQCL